MSFTRFSWRGEPIYDIHKWARDRGEQMIRYRHTVHTPYGPEIDEGEMPESFWNSLMWKGNERYEVIQLR